MKDAPSAARELLRLLAARSMTLACAESCTGGLVSAALTDIPGASRVLWGSVVSYANACKERMLGVDPNTIAERGAVSRECAREMAAGVLKASGADLAVAVTGIAGPEGGSPDKPVGTVWFAWAASDGAAREEISVFAGDRAAIRAAAAARALEGAVDFEGSRRALRDAPEAGAIDK
ncbi:MAG: nicotinamide-nucleotide amidohydrolase family protein [Spirochaetaceae bacterium]|nr:nicotinamide-nucleotide amidohydrolase family protein [Spirochaetaceae bacterium]